MIRVFLIGYMGAGKTTLGKAFARALGLTFVDLDFKNTGVTKVTIYKKDTNKYGDIVFEFINDTSHLANLN